MQGHDPNGFDATLESFALRMRVRILSLVVAALALTALIVHLVVPFASYEVAAQMGVESGSGTWTLQEMKDMRDSDHVMVPGATFGYLLGGLIVLNLGAFAFLLTQFFRGSAGVYGRFGGAIVTALGAAMTLHGHGLWAGRMTGALIHSLGWDAPPAVYKDLMADYAPADIVSLFYPISPLIVFTLAIAAAICLIFAATPRVRDDQMRALASKHGRVAIVAIASFAAILVLPWVVQVMDHGLTELNPEDEDPFFWSAYDVLYLRELTYQEAFEVGEAGLIVFDGLSIAMRYLMVFGIIGIVAPLAAIAGKVLESEGNPVLGRLVENLGLVTIATFAATLVISFLAAFTLHDSEFYPSMTTGLPLLQWIPAVTGIIMAGLVGREVLADETGLVADDFPEPVIYD